MIRFIERYKRNSAIEDYVYKLGPALLRRYGSSDEYTVMQIEKTAQSLKLNMKYIPYAIALFRINESKNTISLYRIDQGFLNILRQEIANSAFNGYMKYSARDIIKLAAPTGWRGGRPSKWVTCQAMAHYVRSR